MRKYARDTTQIRSAWFPHQIPSLPLSLLSLLVLMPLLGSCGSDSTGIFVQDGTGGLMGGGLAPTLLAKAGGDQQITHAGSPFMAPLVVKVEGATGEGLEGVQVDWSVKEGGGIVLSSRTVTDADGFARQGSWLAGTKVGSNQISASVSGVSPVTFSGVGTPGSPAKVTLIPNLVTVWRGQTAQFSVQVTDSLGNPVSAPTQWEIDNPEVATVAESGLVTGLSEGFTDIIVETDDVGAHGKVRVLAPPVAYISSAGGENQTGRVGERLARSFSVEVLDPAGFPAEGIRVGWTIINGQGQLDGDASLTDSRGKAESWLTLGSVPGTTTVSASVEGLKAITFSATSAAGPVSSIVLEPTEVSLRVQEQAVIVAVAKDSKGNIVGTEVTWSSSHPGVASVTESGVVTGVAAGATTLTALAGEVSASVPVVVVDGSAKEAILLGGDHQSGTVGSALSLPLSLKAIDALQQPVEGAEVVWWVTEGEGTITPARVTTDGAGTAKATWTLGTHPGQHRASASVAGAGSLQFTATAEAGPVAVIHMNPEDTTLLVGQEIQFSAGAEDAFGNPRAEAALAWSVSNSEIAQVDQAGKALGLVEGQAEIRASASGVSGAAVLHVESTTPTPPPIEPGSVHDLAVVDVNPSSVTLRWTQVDDGAGHPASFAIWYGSPSLASQGGMGPTVFLPGTEAGSPMMYVWAGLDPNRSYEFQLVPFWETTDPATYGALSNPVSATTPAPEPGPVARILLTPASARVQLGGSQRFQASAQDAFGNPVTGVTFTWTTSHAGIASVNPSGLATGVGAGSAQIRATAAGITASATLTVDPPPQPQTTSPGTVTSLGVLGVSTTSVTLTWIEVDNGTGQPSRYDVRYADSPIGWGWGSATVVTQGSCATPVQGQTVDQPMTCTVEGLSPSHAYDFQLVAYRGVFGGEISFGGLSNPTTGVTSSGGAALPEVTTVTASPSFVAFNGPGETSQITARARDGFGSIVWGAALTWKTLNPSVATVSSSGRISGVGVGSTQVIVSASCCSAADTVSVTVAQPPAPATVDHLTLSPSSVSLETDRTQNLTATVFDQYGAVMQGASVSWSSTNTSVATVNSTGRVTGVAAGSAQVRATSSGKTASAAVTVTQPAAPPTVDHLTVAPSSVSLQVGQGQALTAAVFDQYGAVMQGASVSWSSTNTSVATVNSTGRVTGVAAGSAQVRATSSGKTASATVTVTQPAAPPTVDHLTVVPSSVSLQVGQGQALTAAVFDQYGAVMQGASVSWSSTNTSVATVNSSGSVTAVAAGSAQVRATSSGKTASATVTVTQPAAPPPTPTGAWYTQNWDYTSISALKQSVLWSYEINGSLDLLKGQQTPFGTINALKATVTGGHEATVGVNLAPPRASTDKPHEVWYEVIVKFDADWRTATVPEQTADHKTIFYTETGEVNRWAIHVGVFGSDVQGRINDANFAISGSPAPNLPSWIWDGQWHKLRWHLKQGAGSGVFEAWLDGAKFLSATGINTNSGSRYFDVIALGRNGGFAGTQSMYWGPVNVYITNPGW